LIGDAFGAWWKPNIRNINLLRRRATVSGTDAKRQNERLAFRRPHHIVSARAACRIDYPTLLLLRFIITQLQASF
jgi:hypothetical protein